MKAHLLIPELAGGRLHLGVTGSVAAYKALELLRLWTKCGLKVSAALTEAAEEFVRPLSFSSLGADPVYPAMFSQNGRNRPGSFDHLEPGSSAQAMVIAPATADFLAKLACCLASDMLSSQALSFTRPLVIAPAMNPRLWEAAATRENWEKLRTRGHLLIEPECGDVACGEEGCGRLARLEEIYLAGLKALAPQNMRGHKIMITLGPTKETWDAARFWSNPSSGLMGASLAVTAWLRGARVTVVAGPCQELWLPLDIKRHDVVSAEEMRQACLELWPDADIGCFTAAVADFKPLPYGTHKFKKNNSPQGFSLEFLPNPDILAELSTKRDIKKKRPLIIAFAAESEIDPLALKSKMETKKADLLVANNISAPGSGFGVPTNEVLVMDKNGREEAWPLMSKTEVAWRLWDWLKQI